MKNEKKMKFLVFYYFFCCYNIIKPLSILKCLNINYCFEYVSVNIFYILSDFDITIKNKIYIYNFYSINNIIYKKYILSNKKY